MIQTFPNGGTTTFTIKQQNNKSHHLRKTNDQYNLRFDERCKRMTEQQSDFEWDEIKAESNLKKHGISFEEAVTIFDDFGMIAYKDKEHSWNEEREIAIGYSAQNRLLTVCFTERANKTRIISARKSIPNERKIYENA